ncbi:MAG TPA: hypothetical protein EYP17_10950 [Candidatus Latescibacteria bacterium]|nr:hypothetical protein [Candidatus Latescibacterota bacterium]
MQLRSLVRHISVYGLSDAVNRATGFLLIPLYARVLPREDYGILALLYSILAFAGVLYTWGISGAFLRDFTPADERERREVFSTTLGFLAGCGLLLSGAIWCFGKGVGVLLGVRSGLVRLGASILLLDALTLPFLLSLRARARSGTYLGLTAIRFLSTVGGNLLFVGGMGRGVQGVFEANALASGLVLSCAFPFGIAYLRPKVALARLRRLLSFGLPYVPTLLADRVIFLADRTLLKLLAGWDVLAVYNVGYRLGMVVLFYVRAIEAAWIPFFLSTFWERGAPELYARIFLYYIMAGGFLWLGLSLGAPLILPWYAPGYEEAASVVPIVALAYLVYGLYVQFLVGVYTERRTGMLPAIVGASAALNLGLNFLLIPRFGMAGAAWATSAAYGAMAGTLFLRSRRLYPVPYDFHRAGGVALIAVGTFLAASLSPPALRWGLILAGYPALAWRVGRPKGGTLG